VQRSRQNHFLDCEALAMAIGYSLNVQRIPEGVARRGDDPVEPDPGGVEAPDAAISHHHAPAVPNLRTRFAGLSSRLNR
jgi:hypothetical protein